MPHTFRIQAILFLFIALLTNTAAHAQLGKPDPKYTVLQGIGYQTMDMVVQPDSTIVVVGSFSYAHERPMACVAKLKKDGTNDYAFNIGTGANGAVRTVARQADGKLLIGGEFTSFNGIGCNHIARLNTDGSLDTGFNIGTGFNNTVTEIMVQADSLIMVGGSFSTYKGTAVKGAVRLSPDGSLDNTFAPTTTIPQPNVIIRQPDGKYLIAGLNHSTYKSLRRLNANGSVDSTFNIGTGTDININSMVLLPDGRAYISGSFTTYNGTTAVRMARIHANGSLDTGFNTGTGFNDNVLGLLLESDGKVLVTGDFTTYKGTAIRAIARIDSAGTRDTLFNPGTGLNDDGWVMAHTPDGGILVAGLFYLYNGYSRSSFVKIGHNGAIDNGFMPNTGFNDRVYSMTQQSNGKMLVGGDFTRYGAVAQGNIARMNTDGTLDTTFASGSGANGRVIYIHVLPDDKILIAGRFTTYNGATATRLARLNSDGSLDNTFSATANGDVASIAVSASGKIFIGGSFTTINSTSRSKIAKLNANGSLDTGTSFGGFSGGASVSDMVFQDAGKILVAGTFTTYAGVSANRLMRIDTLGAVDTAFSAAGGANGNINTISLDNAGNITVAGGFTTYNGSSRNGVAKLQANGALHTGFAISSLSGGGISAAIAYRGGVVIGGNFTSVNGTTRNRIAYLDSTGALDAAYYTGTGINIAANVVNKLWADEYTGRILAGGTYREVEGRFAPNFGSFVGSFAGTAIDSVRIDTLVCAGGTLQVRFKKTKLFNTGNVFSAQLSDNSGSFASPVAIGNKQSGGTGWDTLTAEIPVGTTVGSGYKVRIVATNAVATSNASHSFRVDTLAPIVAPLPQTVCSAATHSFTFDSISASADSIEWSLDEGFASRQTVPFNGAINFALGAGVTDTLWIRAKSIHGCTGPKSSTTVSVLAPANVSVSPHFKVMFQQQDLLAVASGGVAYDWLELGESNDTVTIVPDSANAVYKVSITDSLGCVTVDSVTVQAFPMPEISYVNYKDSLNATDTTDIIIESEVPGMDITWTRDSTQHISGSSYGQGPNIKVPLTNDTTLPQLAFFRAKGTILGVETDEITIPVPMRGMQQHEIEIGNITSSISPCTTNVCTLQVKNNTQASQAFNITLTFNNPNISPFNILSSSTVSTGTVSGSHGTNSIFTIPVTIGAGASGNIYYEFYVPCSAIPQTNTSTSITVATTTNATDASVPSIPASMGVNYPFITVPASPGTISLAPGASANAVLLYKNVASYAFNGFINITDNGTSCSDLVTGFTLQKIEGGVTTSISLTTLPVQISLANGGQLKLTANISLDPSSCSSAPCSTSVKLQWGCQSTDLCREVVTNIPVTPQNPAPNIMVSRILPLPANVLVTTKPSDNSCMNSNETYWEYLIKNTSSVPVANVNVALEMMDLGSYTYIRKQDIGYATNDTRFCTDCTVEGTVQESFTDLLETDFVDGTPDCFTNLYDALDPSNNPVKLYGLNVSLLNPGEAVVLKFNTYRCCPSDDWLFNTDIKFNRWDLRIQGKNTCDQSLVSANDGSNAITTYTQGGNTMTTYLAFPENQGISTNIIDEETDLSLTQELVANDINLQGGVATESNPYVCGNFKLFKVLNKEFMGDANTEEWDTEIFTNGVATYTGNNITGANPDGQIIVEFDLPAGVEVDPTTANQPVIMLSNATLWTPTSWNTGIPKPYAVFNISSISTPPATAHDFRVLFANSATKTYLKGCCGNGGTPTVKINTYFVPNVLDHSPACAECRIPLASVSQQVFLECPGCVTPGIIVTNTELNRTTLGYKDVDNDQRPEGVSGNTPVLIPIGNGSGYAPFTNGDLELRKSIVGDELLGITEAYFQEGDDDGGFKYSTWKSYWGTPSCSTSIAAVLSHLYLETTITNANSVGLQVVEAKVIYKPHGGSEIPKPLSFTPFAIPSNDKFVLSITDVDFDPSVLFDIGDEFEWQIKYKVCGNPVNNVTLTTTSQMYLTTHHLNSPYPFASYDPASVVNTGDPPSVSPCENILFICEAYSSKHTVLPVKVNYKEYWGGGENYCASPSVRVKVESTIGTTVNPFPFEFRPVPMIDGTNLSDGPLLSDGTSMYYSINQPSTYTASAIRMYTTGAIDNGVHMLSSEILPSEMVTSPDCYIDLANASYSAPFEHYDQTTNGINAALPSLPSQPPYQHITDNTKPQLFTYDEAFTQFVQYNFAPICSLITPPVAPATSVSTSFGTGVASATVPNSTTPCSAASDIPLDNGDHFTAVINKPTTETIKIEGNAHHDHDDVYLYPLGFNLDNGVTLYNMFVYVNESDLIIPGVGTAQIIGINHTPVGNSCSGVAGPTFINSVPGYDIFTFGDINSYLDGCIKSELVVQMPELPEGQCGGLELNLKVHFVWNCDGYPNWGTLNMSDANNGLSNGCNGGIMEFTINSAPSPVPSPSVSTSFDGDASTVNCTSTLEGTVCVNNASDGGIGNMTADIWLPNDYTISSASLIQINGGTTTVVDNSVTPTTTPQTSGGLPGLEWTFDLNSQTDFDAASYVGIDGLINSEGQLCLLLEIDGNCNAAAYNTTALSATYTGTTYCGTPFTEDAAPFTLAFPSCELPLPYIQVATQNFSCSQTTGDAVLTALPISGEFPLSVTYAWSNTATAASTSVATAGTYTVTVSDGTCAVTASATVSVNTLNAVTVGSNVGLNTLSQAINAGNTLLSLGIASTTPQVVIIDGTFAIDQNYVFAPNCEIIAKTKAQIYITTNSQLTILQGTHLHGCTELWQGINIQHGGKLRLEGNSTSRILIEDAVYAIKHNNGSESQVNYVKFSNNYIGIYAISGIYTSSIVTSIQNSEFTSDRNLLPPYLSLSTLPSTPMPSSGSRGYCGILSKNRFVTNASFCTFSNICNGIVAYNSRVFSNQCKFSNLLGHGYSPNLAYTYPVGTGVYLRQLNESSVGQSIFSSLYVIGKVGNIERDFDKCYYGVYGDRVESYIENNTMADIVGYGVLIKNGRVKSQQILNNQINTGLRGIALQDCFPRANTFRVVDNFVINQGLGPFAGYGIEISNAGPWSGGWFDAADVWRNYILMAGNSFYGIWGNGPNILTCLDNTVLIANPSRAHAGIAYQGMFGAVAQFNHIKGYDPYSSASSHVYPIGIMSDYSPTFLSCNSTEGTYTGTYFSGTMNNSDILGHKFGSHYNGFTIARYCNIKGQPNDPNVDQKSGNQWIGSYYHKAALNENGEFSLAQMEQDGQILYPHLPSCQLPFNPEICFATTTGFVSYDGSYNNDVGECDNNGLFGLGSINPTVHEKRVMYDSAVYEVFPDEMRWQNRWDLYRRIKSLGDSAVLDSVTQGFMDGCMIDNISILYDIEIAMAKAISVSSEMQLLISMSDSIAMEILTMHSLTGDSSEIADEKARLWDSLYLVDSLLQKSNYVHDSIRDIAIDSLLVLNQSLGYSNKSEENMIRLNKVYMHTLAKDSSFSRSDQAEIEYLAFQCPLEGGHAVYKARSLYMLIQDTVFDNLDLCNNDSIEVRRKGRPQSVKSHPAVKLNVLRGDIEYRLFPNPANDKLKIYCNKVFRVGCKVALYDVSGREILSAILPDGQYSTELDVQSLQPGLYIVSISNQNNELYNTKLTIIK